MSTTNLDKNINNRNISQNLQIQGQSASNSSERYAYDAIEWNDFDMAVFQYAQLHRNYHWYANANDPRQLRLNIASLLFVIYALELMKLNEVVSVIVIVVIPQLMGNVRWHMMIS